MSAGLHLQPAGALTSPQGGLLSAQYRFSSTTAAADPGPGRLRYDTGAYGTVTQIFIDDLTFPGVDISNFLGLIAAGDRLYIQAEDDASKFAVWDVTGNTDNTGWFTIDVSLAAAGNFLANNDRVIFMLQIGGAQAADWHEFVPQSANPGTVPANTLWQEDGTTYDVGTLIWGDFSNPAIFGPNFSVGDPGLEQGGINVGGVNYDATQKINSIGGALDAQLILHRHSTSFPPIITYARTNDDTSAHTAVIAGQTLGSQIFVGWSGTHYDIAAVVDVRVPAGTTISPTSLAAEMVFSTVPDGSNTAAIAMIIGSDQIIYGGEAVGETLTLRGSKDAALGRLQFDSPMVIDFDYTLTTSVDVITYNPTIPASGAAVTAVILIDPTITINSGLFIPSTVRDIGQYNQGVTPGFAVHTVFLGQPELRTVTATIQPNQSFMFASQALYENVGAGNVAAHVANIIGMTHNPRLGTRVSGDRLNVTNLTGMSIAPGYGTVAGTFVDFGTIRWITGSQPSLSLFQPGAGTETMDALYGVDFPAMTFDATAPKIVVRSALAANGALNWFLQNNSTAPSEFGTGVVHHDDSGVIQFGGALNAADVSLFWNPTGFFEIFFWSTNDFLQLSSPSADRFLFDANGVAEFNFNCEDGFSIGAQTGTNGNTFGNFVQGAFTVPLAGDFAGFLLTQAGSLSMGALALGRVSAWVINGLSHAGGTATIVNSDTLTVGGMVTSSPGNTITERQSLNVIAGRSRLQSAMQYDPINPAILASGNNNNWAGLLTGTASNGMRHWARIDGNADGTSLITGIDATAAQDGDTFKLTNDGAFNVSLGNQDANSLAANRIITGTGATYVLGPDESCEITYDLATARWRILYGSGA